MRVLLGFAMAITVSGFVISVYWPLYTWDRVLPSPDGQFEIVVLWGDAAAFDDFSYSIYLFPRNLAPLEPEKNKRILMWGIWRNDNYLVYSGYDYPMFRWTGSRSIEIDLDELNYTPFTFNPVKQFSAVEKPVLVSLSFGKNNPLNVEP